MTGNSRSDEPTKDPLDALIAGAFADKAAEFGAESPAQLSTGGTIEHRAPIAPATERSPRRGVLAMAAALILLASVGLFAFASFQSGSNEIVVTDFAANDGTIEPTDDTDGDQGEADGATIDPTATATPIPTEPASTTSQGGATAQAVVESEAGPTSTTPPLPEPSPTATATPEPSPTPTATPAPPLATPEPPPALLDAEEPQRLSSGVPRCVSGVPIDDPLNVREGPGADAPVIATLEEGSCAVRVMGDEQNGWAPVRLIQLRNRVDGEGQDGGGIIPQLIEGWVFASFLVESDRVDSPEAALASRDRSWLVIHEPATPQCAAEAADRAICQVRSWWWQPWGSPCANPGETVATWKLDEDGHVSLARAGGAWTVTDTRILALDC